jgi:hypothetical protein
MVMGWTAELNPSFWITSSGCEYLAPPVSDGCGQRVPGRAMRMRNAPESWKDGLAAYGAAREAGL